MTSGLACRRLPDETFNKPDLQRATPAVVGMNMFHTACNPT